MVLKNNIKIRDGTIAVLCWDVYGSNCSKIVPKHIRAVSMSIQF